MDYAEQVEKMLRRVNEIFLSVLGERDRLKGRVAELGLERDGLKEKIADLVRPPKWPDGVSLLATVQMDTQMVVSSNLLKLVGNTADLQKFAEWLVWYAGFVAVDPEREAYSIG